MLDYIMVGTGGLVGAIVRFSLSKLIVTKMDNVILNSDNNVIGMLLSLPTLYINLLACLIIGMLVPLFEDKANLFLLLITGFLGAFSTFSTFGYELYKLVVEGHNLIAFAYVTTSVLGGLAAVALGFWLTSLLSR